MAGANKIRRSSFLVSASAAVLLAAACSSSSSSHSTSPDARASVGAFDGWYKSFLVNRHYKTCPQEVSRLDPSRDEKADWDAGKRQFFIQMPDPRVSYDSYVGPFVPGLENCNVSPTYPAERDIQKLQDVLAPPTPDLQACRKAAFAYVASYNSLRAKRHPAAEKELCSSR